MIRHPISRKYLTIGIILLFVGVTIAPTINFNTVKAQGTEKSQQSRGNWLYVGGSGPGNYTKIQDAIENANEGDSVFVYRGLYHENLVLYNDGISLIGEDKYTTIVDGIKKNDVLRIYGNFTSIKDFTIQNSSNMHVGIAVQILMNPKYNIRNVHISNCIIKNNDLGVIFNNVSQSSISHCQIYNLTAQSITVRLLSENISITNCTIHDSGEYVGGGWISSGNIYIDGWHRYNCSNITICNNEIYNLLGNGITITKSKNVHISHNNIYKNSVEGISIGATSYCQIDHNNIFENSYNGIIIEKGDVEIFNNYIYKNGVGEYYDGGILLQDCFNNITTTNNIIKENNQYGLLLIRSSMNLIAKNDFINNTINAYFLQRALFNHWSENYWDRPRILPYPIFGIKWGCFIILTIPWVNLDWHPAQAPYDI